MQAKYLGCCMSFIESGEASFAIIDGGVPVANDSDG